MQDRQAAKEDHLLAAAESEAAEIAEGYAQQQGFGNVPVDQASAHANVIYEQVMGGLRSQRIDDEVLELHAREVAEGALRAGVDTIRHQRISEHALGKV